MNRKNGRRKRRIKERKGEGEREEEIKKKRKEGKSNISTLIATNLCFFNLFIIKNIPSSLLEHKVFRQKYFLVIFSVLYYAKDLVDVLYTPLK